MADVKVEGAAPADEASDAGLLERFASQREEAAFAALVRRHGPLVLGVCRRVLHHEQDAEDAFQAVFCVLARKAGSVRKRAAVGAWLHSVAVRIAKKALSRRGRVVSATNLPDVAAAEESPEWLWHELRPVLDDEVQRLPQKYRQAFVLCYLEGCTNEQAAAELRCPVGTVLSRLNRARERLRSRLTRRGVVLSAGALVAVLGSPAAGSAVPPGLAHAATQAAAAFATGSATASAVAPGVAELANGFLRTLARLKLLQLCAGVLAAVAVVATLLVTVRRPIPSPDRQLLQGTWSVVTAEQNGAPFNFPMRMIFMGEGVTFAPVGGAPQSASVQLDSAREPRQITFTTPDDLKWPGIYRFEPSPRGGYDLRLCLNHRLANQPDIRPTDFKTSPTTPTVAMYTLMRVMGVNAMNLEPVP